MKISKTKLSIEMARSGMNFLKLAKKSGVSRTTLSYINNGKSCSPIVAGKIASALRTDICGLVEGSEST
jgi:putative transcriptional regulator